MGSEFTIDTDTLKQAVTILDQIPADLDPGGGASVADLDACAGIVDDLSKFGSGDDGSKSVGDILSAWIEELHQAITTHVNEVKQTCSSLGDSLSNTIKTYEATEQANQGQLPSTQ